MGRERTAIKSGVIGIISQFSMLITKFVVRTMIIRYLGREILGLDAVIVDVVSMLSLADMGINTAMLFRLYSPVIHHDTERISSLMASYRYIFRVIAGAVGLIGLVVSFFLPLIIHRISYSWSFIYIAYFLQVFAVVASYLLSYKRILLDADQRHHIAMIVDLFSFVAFGIFEVISLLIWKNYIIYLILIILQPISANLGIAMFVRRKYGIEVDKGIRHPEDVRQLFGDAKEVLGSKIATYVYNSTDNVVISISLGTLVVGTLSNYRYISNALKSLVNSAMSAMQPLIGNFLNAKSDQRRQFEVLQIYTVARFIFVGGASVVTVGIISDFILIWSGNSSYQLPISVPMLLLADFYMGALLGPLSEYLTGLGKFRVTKKIAISGACINLILSVTLVKIIGINGVLIGTVVSQGLTWILDIRIVFSSIFSKEHRFLREYLASQGCYIVIMVISTALIYLLRQCVFSSLPIYVRIILTGLTGIIIFLIISCMVARRRPEFAYLVNRVTKFVSHRDR